MTTWMPNLSVIFCAVLQVMAKYDESKDDMIFLVWQRIVCVRACACFSVLMPLYCCDCMCMYKHACVCAYESQISLVCSEFGC